MVAYTNIYSSAANSIQNNYILQVCSGKIHFYDLQKFNLETCSEKPEVDIMMPSLVPDLTSHLAHNRSFRGREVRTDM